MKNEWILDAGDCVLCCVFVLFPNPRPVPVFWLLAASPHTHVNLTTYFFTLFSSFLSFEMVRLIMDRYVESSAKQF